MVKGHKHTDPKLFKKIYELRNKGLDWEAISKEIENTFETKIHRQTIKTYYEDYVRRGQVITNSLRTDKRRAKELTIDWNKKLEEKFNKIDSMTNKFMEVLEDLFDESMGSENKLTYIKLIPTGLAVCREILNQLLFIKKQQEQIIVNQKNVVYSPLQIMNIMDKEMKKKVKENEIKIVDKKTGKVKKKLYID